MGEIVLALHDQSVSLSYPDMLQDDIASLFGAAVAAILLLVSLIF